MVIPLFVLLLLMILTVPARASGLIDCEKTGTLTAAHLNQRLQTVFGPLAPPPASHAACLYALRYHSHDAKGRRVTLSGLLALPVGGAPRGLVVFTHGTTADRNLSPSRFTGKTNSPEVEAAVLAFVSSGYAAAMPDYLGLGVDKGVHPYPLGKVNCASAIDLLEPARTAAERLGSAVGPRLFITGYSEGGAVALWTVRSLEQMPGVSVTAAAPMAGPYDLTGTTAHSLVAPTTNPKIFAARLYLLAYLLNSVHREDGIKVTDYVVPVMAAVIVNVFGKNLSDEAIIKRLALAATLRGARNSVGRITTGRFQTVLRTNDLADPVLRELQTNNCFDWSPRTKLCLICLESDGIVVPENTHKALKAMRARRVGPETLQEFVIHDPSLNHATALVPSLAQARRFFDKQR